MIMGEYCTDMQYYGTPLPRIPVPIERKIKVFLPRQERGLFCVGAKARAIYGDEENEPAWYEAVIDSIEEGEGEAKAAAQRLQEGPGAFPAGHRAHAQFLATMEANGIILSKGELAAIVRAFRGLGMQDVVKYDEFLRVCMLCKDRA